MVFKSRSDQVPGVSRNGTAAQSWFYTVTETQLLDSEDQVVSIMYDGLSEDDLAFNFLMTYRDDG